MMDADFIIEQLTSLSSNIIGNIGDSFDWESKSQERSAVINPLLDELYTIKNFLNSKTGFSIAKEIYSKLKRSDNFNLFFNELTSCPWIYYGGLLKPTLNHNILDGYSILRVTSNSLFTLITGRPYGVLDFNYDLMSNPKSLLNELNNLSDGILFDIGDSFDWESKSQERSALINPLLDNLYFFKLFLGNEININSVKSLFTEVTGLPYNECSDDFGIFFKSLISSRGLYYGGYVSSSLNNGVSDGYSFLRNHINSIKCLLEGFIPKIGNSKSVNGFYS